MSSRVAIQHHTQYNYDRMVSLSPHFVRLRPAAHATTIIESYKLTIKPENHLLHWQQDPFGNFLARVDFQEAMTEMSIGVEIVADMVPTNPFDFILDEYASSFPFAYEPQLKKDLSPYLEITQSGPRLTQWLQKVDQSKQGIIEFLIKLNQLVFQDIAYSIRMQPGVLTPEETLEQAIGSCRDSGWLLVHILRHFGLATRFVSGYLVQLAPDVQIPDDPAGPIVDMTALHAWAEVYLPGAGWIGLDATSGMLAGSGHIPLACTPDPAGAAPVTGTTGPSETTLTYTNTVVRLN